MTTLLFGGESDGKLMDVDPRWDWLEISNPCSTDPHTGEVKENHICGSYRVADLYLRRKVRSGRQEITVFTLKDVYFSDLHIWKKAIEKQLPSTLVI